VVPARRQPTGGIVSLIRTDSPRDRRCVQTMWVWNDFITPERFLPCLAGEEHPVPQVFTSRSVIHYGLATDSAPSAPSPLDPPYGDLLRLTQRHIVKRPRRALGDKWGEGMSTNRTAAEHLSPGV